MAFKINGGVDFTTNVAKIANDISRELKKIPSAKISIDTRAINDLKKAVAGIGTAFKSGSFNNSINSINRGLSNTSKSLKSVKSSASSASSEMEKFGKSTAATVRRFTAFIAVVGVFNTVRDALRESSKEAINFEKSMIKVSQVTGASIGDLGDLEREITRLSTSLGVSSTKLVNVALTLSQAGISAKDTKKALDVLAKTELSATFDNIESTAEGAIAIMSQFGTSAKDLEGQLSSVNTIAAKFAVESGDLITAIRKAGGAFQATGGDLNELLALFTSVRATTRESADSIATGLRTIFTRLQRPRTLSFLEDLGISLKDTKGEFIGVYKSIETLAGALKTISGTDPRFNQIIEELGGFRQVSRVIPLIKQFETSQKALAVGQRSTNSLTEDAVVAQKSLANQIARVREEFNAFTRSLVLSDLKVMIKLTLDLASAFIRVADALRPLTPLLAGVGFNFLYKNAQPFVKGYISEFANRKKFARGGIVPGSGSGDTVPSMLESGEFVVKKSAVKAFGANNLHAINKYASGGLVEKLKRIRRFSAGQGSREFKNIKENGFFQTVFGGAESDSLSNQLGGLKNSILGKAKSGLGFARSGFGFLRASSSRLGASGAGLASKLKDGIKGIGRSLVDEFAIPGPLPAGGGVLFQAQQPAPTKNKRILTESLKILRQAQRDLGGKFNSGLVNSVRVTSNLSGKGSSLGSLGEDASIRGLFSPSTKRISVNSSRIKDFADLRRLILHELGHAIDFGAGDGKFSSGKGLAFKLANEQSLRQITNDRQNKLSFKKVLEDVGKKNVTNKDIEDFKKYRYSTTESFANVFREYILDPEFREALDKRGFRDKILSKVGRFAKGGSVGTDTQPALLTPGEFVINKQSARAFGYGNLNKINRYAKGGAVGKGEGLSNSLLLAGIAGPQVISSVASQFGDFKQFIDPFTNALTLATTSLFLFSTALKKDTDTTNERINKLQKNINKRIANRNTIEVGLNETKQSGIKGIIQADKDKFDKPIIDLARRRNQIKQVIKRAGNNNPTLSNQAFTKFLDLDAQLKAAVSARKNKNPQDLTNQVAFFARDFDRNRNKVLSKLDRKIGKRNKGLDKLTDQLLQEERFNALGNRIGIASSAGFAGGAILTGFAQSNVAAGSRTTLGAPTGVVAGAGSALTGAASGASLGMAAGPYGALVGAVIGGLTGFAIGLNDAETALNNFDFSEKFGKFDAALKSIFNGKSTLGNQRFGIDSFLKDINKEFLSKTGEEFNTFKAEVSSSVDALDVYLAKIIELGKSSDEIIKENKELVLVLSRFGNQGVGDIETRIKEQVKIRDKELKNEKRFVELQEQNEKRLRAIFTIGGAVGDAQRVSRNFDVILDSLNQFASGISNISANFDFSALDNIGSANVNDVRNQALTASRLIGGSSGQLANDVITSTSLIQDLPVILNKLVNTNQLDERDIVQELRDAIGQGFAQDLIVSKFNSVVGGTGNTVEFLKKFKEDPASVTKELQSSIDPIVNALKDSLPDILNQFESFDSGLAASRENFFHSLEGLSKVIDIEESKAGFRGSFFGNPLSFATRQGFENRRLGILTGGSSVAQLGGRLNATQANIAGLLAERQQFGGDSNRFKQLTSLISEQITEEERVRKALEASADVNTRLTNVTQELERLQRIREAKTNLAKDFAFGDPEAQRSILKGIVGAGQIQANLQSGQNPFQGLSREMIDEARNVFETFSEARIFSGKTGKETINEILTKTIGFNPEEANAEEAAILKLGDEILDSAKAAQEILNANLTNNNDKFLTGLGQKFDAFFVGLEKSFKDREEKIRNENEGVKNTKAGEIDKGIETLTRLGKQSGFDLTTDESRKVLANSFGISGKIRGLKNQQNEAGRLANGDVTDDELRTIFGADAGRIEKNVAGPNPFIKLLFGRFIGPRSREKIIGAELKKLQEKREKEIQELEKELFNNVGVGPGQELIRNGDRIEKALKNVEQNVGAGGIDTLRKKKANLRANGGPVWSKRGSDTVPAMTTDGQPYMLTPGEMIMNRRAVGKYGSILNKMNYAADGSFISDFYGRPAGVNTPSNIIKDFGDIKATGNEKFPYSYKGVKYGSLRAAELARDGQLATTNPTILDARKRRGVRPDGSSFNRNQLNLSIRGNPSVQNKRYGGTPDTTGLTSSDIQSRRAQYQKDLNHARKNGATPQQAKDFANNQVGAPFLGTFKGGNNKGLNTANTAKNNPQNTGPGVNPKALEDFNKTVEKLNGMKLELVISGNLNVNITQGNLNEQVRSSLKEFVEVYTENLVKEEINKLIGDANLAVLPRPIGQKKGEV